MPLTQTAASLLASCVAWPSHHSGFSGVQEAKASSLHLTEPSTIHTHFIYTQLSRKNSAERRGELYWVKVGQDDIQAHFQLVYDPDIPFLIQETHRTGLFLHGRWRKWSPRSEWGLPKHTSKRPGEVQKYPDLINVLSTEKELNGNYLIGWLSVLNEMIWSIQHST